MSIGESPMSQEKEAEIRQRVKAQFGRRAEAYATSRPHALGDSLTLMVEWGDPQPSSLVLDIATGTGFTAFAFAERAKTVVATDLTFTMLEEARRLAKERGLSNISLHVASAEALPFHETTFDLVTCRIAPHHFADVKRFLQEARRVLKPKGALVLTDSSSPEDPEAARWQQEVEKLRDPSHVRNYTPSEWQGMVEEAEFTIERFTTEPCSRLIFSDWVERSGTPLEIVADLRERFQQASGAVQEAFQITNERDEVLFSWMLTILLARKG
ncbi:MAG: methyltransferase domain-containing protein [candidate division NC10 bacterium]|nr:methyltransferase domain-containing protein [candidate division NC10 bacterium]